MRKQSKLNRPFHKRTSTEALADTFYNLEPQTVPSRPSVSRGRRAGHVHGSGLMHTLSLSTSMSEERSMTLLEKKSAGRLWNKNNGVDRSTQLRGSAVRVTVCAKASLSSKRGPAPVRKSVYGAVAQRFDVLGDLWVDKKSRNDALRQVRKERKCLMEEVSAYKVKLEKIAKTMLEKEEAVETITHSPLDTKSL